MRTLILGLMVMAATGAIAAENCSKLGAAAKKETLAACTSPKGVSKKCRADADKAKADAVAKCKAEQPEK